jgi:hypothetical protein
VCTAPNVSLNKCGESDFAYHQTMSISKVWTKKGVGVETMRSRNLVPRVSEMKNYPLYRSDVRVVSGNAVVRRDFVFITFKNPSRLHPSWFIFSVNAFCRRTYSARP